jgi:hypothetical protein
MLKPTFKTQIRSEVRREWETFEPGAQSPAVSFMVNQDMDIPADDFEVVFGVSDETTEALEGDWVSIQLGYEDDPKEVFNGIRRRRRARDLRGESKGVKPCL